MARLREAPGCRESGWTTREPGDRWRRLSPAEARKPALGSAGGCPEWRDEAISAPHPRRRHDQKINRPGDHRAQRPGQINATGDRGQHDRRNQPTGGSANGSTGQITGQLPANPLTPRSSARAGSGSEKVKRASAPRCFPRAPRPPPARATLPSNRLRPSLLSVRGQPARPPIRHCARLRPCQPTFHVKHRLIVLDLHHRVAHDGASEPAP